MTPDSSGLEIVIGQAEKWHRFICCEGGLHTCLSHASHPCQNEVFSSSISLSPYCSFMDILHMNCNAGISSFRHSLESANRMVPAHCFKHCAIVSGKNMQCFPEFLFQIAWNISNIHHGCWISPQRIIFHMINHRF